MADKRRKPQPVRAAAARLLQQVRRGRSLSDLLPGFGERVPPRDRALLAELSYGVCRWQFRLAAQLDVLIDKPLKAKDEDLRQLLLLGLYQLQYTRIKPHAAVAETVQVVQALDKGWARGLVNGVLRRYQREAAEIDARADADPAARHAFPGWLFDAVQRSWPEQCPAVFEAANQRPPMTLRVNRLQGGRDEYAKTLAEAGISARPADCPDTALVLDTPVDVQTLPGFATGRVSVQDAGAQLAAGLLALQPGQRVLDACAAPGGKTGHLLESEPGIRLTAMDLDAQRLERVTENLQRLGLDAELVTGDAGAPTGDWAARSYERILLDVPCSASGVIRRHPDIKLLRRAEDITSLAVQQARIMDAVWPLLAAGGMLLYATCSILPEENEEQIRAFMTRTRNVRLCDMSAHQWGHQRPAGRQILPGEQGMDGFYYALLEKSA